MLVFFCFFCYNFLKGSVMMSKDIEQVINDAASNVACENGNLSIDELKQIKHHVMGMYQQSDDSFIYGLVKTINEGDNDARKTK